MTNEIPLNAFGDVSGSCDTLNISEGDWVKTVSIAYSSSDVS